LVLLIVAGKGLLAHLTSRHDSRPLAEAMLAQEVSGTRFAVLGKADKYGLDFYLDGRVSRIALGRPTREPFDGDVNALAEMLRSSADKTTWVIAFKGDPRRLTAALDQAGVPYTLHPGDWNYRLLVVPPPSAPADDTKEAAT